MTRTTPPTPAPAARPARAARPRRRNPLARLGGTAAGVVFLIIGVITGPTPIPIGLIFIAIGLYLLARDSGGARRAIRWLRRRIPALDRGLCHMAPRLPRAVGVVIRRTAPMESRHRLTAAWRARRAAGEAAERRRREAA